LPQQIGSARRI